MTETIEVPISLIKAGDMDAIRRLLPKENLFGRWATHPEHGRGIIFSEHPREDGLVRFSYKNRCFAGGTVWEWVAPDDLTLDPVELTTEADLKDAPVGTVIAMPREDSYQKTAAKDWESRDYTSTNQLMARRGPWKILRWGWGE